MPPALDSFQRAVEDAARRSIDGRRLRGMDFAWGAVSLPSPRFAMTRRFESPAKLDVKPASYEAAALAAASAFVAPDARGFIRRLAQVTKVRAADADLDKTKIAELVLQGLVRVEYLVQCRKDSHVLASMGSVQELDTVGRQLACPVCSRLFSDESTQEIYALTDLGRTLAASSRWMTIWVTDLLVKAGVPLDKIAWNAVSGGDELDIMTEVFGPRVFFELKDREFGLGDAYPFASRVVRYGGRSGVVVTTERVAEEAKEYFKEQQVRIDLVEGTDPMMHMIPKLVDKFSRTGVEQQLAELGDPVGDFARPVVSAWMLQISEAQTRAGSRAIVAA